MVEIAKRMMNQKNTTMAGLGMAAIAVILWFELATPEQLVALMAALTGAGLMAARDAGNGSDSPGAPKPPTK